MTNMSSEAHYDEAEKLLKEAESHREPDTRAEWCLELARIHLALSQASIAARALDRREKAAATTAGTAEAGSQPSDEAAGSPFPPHPPKREDPRRHRTGPNRPVLREKNNTTEPP